MPQIVSSKNLLLSTRPLVVAVVSQTEVLQDLVDNPRHEHLGDLFELRLDLLNLPAQDLRAAIPLLGLPVLLTARHPVEGGQGSEDAAGRIAMIEPLLDLASLIDIELRSVQEMRPLIDKARARSVGVIGSFHDFKTTPSVELLRGALEMARMADLDAAKFAAYLNSSADLIRLMGLFDQAQSGKRKMPISVMGMGSLGRMSRLVLAKLGSILNYGYLGDSNAPGQWPAPRLKELLTEL
jgi:3-dehydroquinate dehydratase I